MKPSKHWKRLVQRAKRKAVKARPAGLPLGVWVRAQWPVTIKEAVQSRLDERVMLTANFPAVPLLVRRVQGDL